MSDDIFQQLLRNQQQQSGGAPSPNPLESVLAEILRAKLPEKNSVGWIGSGPTQSFIEKPMLQGVTGRNERKWLDKLLNNITEGVAQNAGQTRFVVGEGLVAPLDTPGRNTDRGKGMIGPAG